MELNLPSLIRSRFSVLQKKIKQKNVVLVKKINYYWLKNYYFLG